MTTNANIDAAKALLEDFLACEAVPETCYDYIQSHGFLTALSVGPSLPATEVWLAEIFDGEPRYESADERADIEAALQLLLESLGRDLYSGEQLSLPCALNLGMKPSQAPLRGWALGFMEGVGLQEDQWFADAEEEVGGLLLPIVVAAGLFDDPELQKLTRDPKQTNALLKQIPDNLSELYLLFREEHHEHAENADEE